MSLGPADFKTNPPIQSVATDRHSGRRLISWVFASAFIIINLFAFRGELNADWESYRWIFDDGAWLRDQNRDTAFLAFIDAAKFVGFSEYEYFRVLVILIFTAFTALFLKYWSVRAVPKGWLFSYLAVIPLFLPRFTIQIREGLAMCLVLIAITIFCGRWRSTHGIRASALVGGSLVLLLATRVNSATAIFLAPLAVTVALEGVRRWSRHSVEKVFWFISFATLAVAGVAFISGYFGQLVDAQAPIFYEGFIDKGTEFDLNKSFYWALRTAILFFIIKEFFGLRRSFQIPPAFSNFLAYSVYVLAPILHFACVFIIFSGTWLLAASSASRLYQTVLLTALMFIWFYARKSTLLLIVIAFTIVDQYRVMIVAAST
jgi:hypothetical protein